MRESKTVLAIVRTNGTSPGRYINKEGEPYRLVQEIVARSLTFPTCVVTLVDPPFEVLLNEVKTGQYADLVILDERTIVDTVDEAAPLSRALKRSLTGLITGRDGKPASVHTEPIVIKWAMEKVGQYSDDFPALLAADRERRSQS